MNRNEYKKIYLGGDYESYVVQYRGDILGQLEKVDYAVGFIITEKIAIIGVEEGKVKNIRADIPSILLIEVRTMYELESISVDQTSNINYIKQNKFLGLTGEGVLVGIIDTGIDYLNPEFCNEDGTTRIVKIWDQSIEDNSDSDVFIGKEYSRDDINKAIIAKNNGEDPYAVVASKDENGHGTRMAGVIGARGVSSELRGVSSECEFAIVKLLEDINFKRQLKKNDLENAPVYDGSEVLAAIDYLAKLRNKENKPMVIMLGVGSTGNSHDGNGLVSRHINEISQYNPLVVVTGTGNQAASEAHASGFIKNIGGREIVELNIPQVMESLELEIWIKKPNKISINIISPSGEESRIIKAKINQVEEIRYVYDETDARIEFHVPHAITGNQAIFISFTDIKPGIWKFELIGDYIIEGRYDIWLPPQCALPKGMKFLKSSTDTTLTIPSTAEEAIPVGYYDSNDDDVENASGRGFTLNNVIKPEIVAPGVNILTTDVGSNKALVSGSCVAASIVAGTCALLFQWGIINKNDFSMNAIKLKAYLILGANRDKGSNYPNQTFGYGKLDLKGTFDAIAGQRCSNDDNHSYNEYNIGNLFIKVPRRFAYREDDDAISGRNTKRPKL